MTQNVNVYHYNYTFTILTKHLQYSVHFLLKWKYPQNVRLTLNILILIDMIWNVSTCFSR